jgi:hypothetical protein
MNDTPEEWILFSLLLSTLGAFIILLIQSKQVIVILLLITIPPTFIAFIINVLNRSTTNANKFSGKNVLITGAASGIGRELALLFG